MKWLLFALWLELNILELMGSWFHWKQMLIAETNLMFLNPDGTWWIMAIIQIVTASVLGWVLIKQKLYGILTALILLMGYLAWKMA